MTRQAPKMWSYSDWLAQLGRCDLLGWRSTPPMACHQLDGALLSEAEVGSTFPLRNRQHFVRHNLEIVRLAQEREPRSTAIDKNL